MGDTFARVRSWISNLTSTLRWADLFDVVVVAVLAYFLIAWFKRARSRFVMGGFASLALLYLIARLLEMYLTLLVFQALVTVALIAVVVIFQEDIRRGFERIAMRGQLRAADRAPGMAEVVSSVTQAARQLARQKIGALIVFRGKEPLARHLSGGIQLDGRVSEALLYSIFDPSSAGHDGAIVIDGALIRSFAVHLPLASRSDGRLGTRHTAALGLSERSDALVVVVSEERGTISVARGGELEVVSPEELERRISTFVREVSPERPQTLWRRLTADPGTKALSLAIALGLWVMLFGPQRETIARTLSVPIVYRDVPEGWLLEEPDPPEARVTLTGPSRAFTLLDRDALVITLDLGEMRSGRRVLDIDDSEINQPAELAIHRVDPPSVRVVAHPTEEVELPVRVEHIGKLPARSKLGGFSVSPERVKLAIAKSARAQVRWVHTEPVDLSRIDATTTVTRPLKIPKQARLVRGAPSEVSVRVEVVPR